MPDRDLIDGKVESLRRCLNRVSDKTPADVETLKNDYDTQDILSVNLQRAIQLCVDIGAHVIADNGWRTPSTMADTFPVLEKHGVIDSELSRALQHSVGFRNVSVHEYEEIDWDRVFRYATDNLDTFRKFVTAILELVDQSDTSQTE